MTVAAIIVAAGRGSRMGHQIPKQYRMLAGKPVLTRTLECFLAHPAVDSVQPVIHPDDETLFASVKKELSACLEKKLRAPVHGGDTRQQSVQRGLEAVACSSDEDPSGVLIHDAARPFVSRR